MGEMAPPFPFEQKAGCVPIWHRNVYPTARPDDTGELGQCRLGVGKVLQAVLQDCDVKALVSERQVV